MRVLGIESSCDETGVAIYDDERGLVAHALHTQIAMHAEYGGGGAGLAPPAPRQRGGAFVHPLLGGA